MRVAEPSTTPSYARKLPKVPGLAAVALGEGYWLRQERYVCSPESVIERRSDPHICCPAACNGQLPLPQQK